ncbi:MAG: glycosyltransferase family 39 protein [Synergistaceae bacterium]|nr:glycosyltransferase family 39 protein [Synergistaceae bacterium]
MRPARKTVLLIFAVLLFLFFRGTGDHGLLDPVEGINASVALNMAGRRDFFTPLAEDLPYLGRSMGFWWLSASALLLFGWTEAALRFWSALGGVGMAAAGWFVARRTADGRTANYAAVLTGTSLLTYAASQLAAPYTLYAFCVTGALAGIVYGFRDRRFFLLLHGASSAALIVCGPAGLLLPWLCFLLYAHLTAQERFFARAFFYWPGLLTTLALGGGYLLLLRYKNPTLLALMRYLPAGAGFGSFSSTVLFFVFGFFPWAGLVPETFRRARPGDWFFILPSERVNTLLLVWTAVFLLFGLLSKDAFFLAAPLPALAVLCASCLAEAPGDGGAEILRRTAVWETRFFGVCLILGLPWMYFRGAGTLQKTLMSLVPWMVFSLLFLFAWRRHAKTGRIGKLMLQLSFLAFLSLMPLAGVFDLLAGSLSLRESGLYLREELKLNRDARIVQYGANHPSLFFYTAKPSLPVRASPTPGVSGQKILDDDALDAIWGGPQRVFMIVERNQEILRPLKKAPFSVHEESGRIVLSNRGASGVK